MDEKEKKSFIERVFFKVNSIDKVLESRVDTIYLAVCLLSLGYKLIAFTIEQGALNFSSIKIILTDGLFTLIVIAIVKTLFIKNGFDYSLTFLEIAFVVIIRKLILLETIPSETSLLVALGITSSIFFILIIYIHNLKRKWQKEAS